VSVDDPRSCRGTSAPPSEPAPSTIMTGTHREIAILGAGFGGLCMAVRLTQAGHRNFVILEKASSLGGTWRDNTYPGCACDIPSGLYSMSFEQHPGWTRTFATQPEILRYLETVARKHRLEERIVYDAHVTALRWCEPQKHWQLTMADGQTWTARVVISAVGGLHIPRVPDIAGLEHYTGVAFHSSKWRHDVDLADKTVAVIGTGASAAQIIPQIAPRVRKLLVFQRTAAWVLPRRDRPTTGWGAALMSRLPPARRFWRAVQFAYHEVFALGFTVHPSWVGRAERNGRDFLVRSVPDKLLRWHLIPHHRLGCKRVILSDDFYTALSRSNVELVTPSIVRFSSPGPVTGNGREWPADVVVFATGFRPFNLTDGLSIAGRDGRQLAGDWAAGPEAYRGVAVTGYPNFFMLMGPNSGLGHNSIVFMIEVQVRYILACLKWLASDHRGGPGLATVEVRAEAQRRYNAWLQRRFDRTVWKPRGSEATGAKAEAGGCQSWYADEAGRNFTLWPGFATGYWWTMRRPRLADFHTAGLQEAEGRVLPHP
jgi:cation diffusion facilitator CzcD-associated flavoprotein CzcO